MRIWEAMGYTFRFRILLLHSTADCGVIVLRAIGMVEASSWFASPIRALRNPSGVKRKGRVLPVPSRRAGPPHPSPSPAAAGETSEVACQVSSLLLCLAAVGWRERQDCPQRRSAGLQRPKVAWLVVRGVVFPTAIENANPFIGQGAHPHHRHCHPHPRRIDPRAGNPGERGKEAERSSHLIGKFSPASSQT